ncbi:hypothetical protein ACH4F6_03775 [Streptomyces sp. NPDC017936]|uniref:hypothetical protein n=1 Tax=Streptomyces sp. NPDC017936 TaxID=3365016 RepID=UPI0037A05BCB
MAVPNEPERRDTRLAVLCARLAEPGGPLAEDAGLRALAADAVARVRQGRDRDEIDACLDELEDGLLAAGHTAGLGAYRTVPAQPHPAFEPLPGLGAGRPLLEVLTCPRERCTRVEAPPAPGASAAGPPHCALFGEPLKPFDVTP